MADHGEDSKVETVMENLADKVGVHDRSPSSSSSSDSDDDKKDSSLKAKIHRLFGREKPVHKVLGGGKRNFFFYLFPLLEYSVFCFITFLIVQFLSLYFISTFPEYGGGVSVFSLSGEKLEKKKKIWKRFFGFFPPVIVFGIHELISGRFGGVTLLNYSINNFNTEIRCCF